MTNLKEILALPPAERDDEIRKLIVPKPWRHKFVKNNLVSTECLNCGMKHHINFDVDCPIPDRIDLDWNLAMKMKWDTIEEIGYNAWLNGVQKVAISVGDFEWPKYAKEHHYILAAIIAKEIDE